MIFIELYNVSSITSIVGHRGSLFPLVTIWCCALIFMVNGFLSKGESRARYPFRIFFVQKFQKIQSVQK